VPHETRRVRKKADIELKANGAKLHIDVIDTPGIATQIDFHEFVEDHGMDEEEARRRAKEATEGVIEAIRWLDDVDGVLLVMDCAEDPFTQVNVTILGNLEARKLPVIIVANKIDLPEASPATLKAAFPQHPVVPVSAGEGTNVDALYEAITKHFR
jgi:small GTP-binding protein